jgi:hypothetical protein
MSNHYDFKAREEMYLLAEVAMSIDLRVDQNGKAWFYSPQTGNIYSGFDLMENRPIHDVR